VWDSKAMDCAIAATLSDFCLTVTGTIPSKNLFIRMFFPVKGAVGLLHYRLKPAFDIRVSVVE